MSNRTDHRTTVSLAEVVWKMAEDNMAAKGFNDNFSAYVADLIRRDQERSAVLREVPPPYQVSSNQAGTAGESAIAAALHAGLGVAYPPSSNSKARRRRPVKSGSHEGAPHPKSDHPGEPARKHAPKKPKQ